MSVSLAPAAVCRLLVLEARARRISAALHRLTREQAQVRRAILETRCGLDVDAARQYDEWLRVERMR